MSETQIYQCKNCSQLLFLEEHVGQHNGVRQLFESTQKCQVFIQNKPKWLNLEGQEGIIYCPKCKSKIGKFKWHGDTCSCGQLVVPYIAFYPSKLSSQKIKTDRQDNIKVYTQQQDKGT